MHLLDEVVGVRNGLVGFRPDQVAAMAHTAQRHQPAADKQRKVETTETKIMKVAIVQWK